MDIALTQALNKLAGTNAALDAVMIAITIYGIFALVFAVILLWWKQAERSEARNACVVAGLSFLASLAFNQLLLLFVHRIRPYDAGVSHLLIAANPDWSFPSDHATAAAAIVAALWFKHLRSIAKILSAVAILICVSRVYVGVHYFSDILGGVAIGVFTAALVARCYRNSSWYAQRITSIL